MYRWHLGAVAVAMAGLAACQPGPLDDTAWPEAKPLGERLNAYRQTAQPSELASEENTAALADPTGELTLREAMALAIVRSPKLRTFNLDVRRSETHALQAGRRPNPELEVEFDNFAGSGPYSGTDSLETTVSLAQTFPLGGDIALHREVALYQGHLAGWDYESARLELLTDVTQRYVAVLAAHGRIHVAREAMELSQEVLSATKKRIDAGDAPPIEAARASVPVAMAQVALHRAERQFRAARKQLSLTWASSEPTFAGLTGSLDELVPPPAAEQLVSLINQNPAVARWVSEISARRAEARLAQAQAVPDVTGRIGLRDDRAEDAQALVVGISLPLPIFNRGRADILAARLGEASAQLRQREAELRIESMLSEAYTRLVNTYDEATAIRDIALPPATEAFDVTRRAFEQGDMPFLDVLDAERTLVDLRMQHIEALVDYHKAAAEIEGLIARPLDQLAANPGAPSTQTKE